MIKRWPYHVVTTRRHQDKPSTKGLNDTLRRCGDQWTAAMLTC
jgi:hypothetical protein